MPDRYPGIYGSWLYLMTAFTKGYSYYLITPTHGLAIGNDEGKWKLFRIWQQADNKFYHHCLSVFLNIETANMLAELFELNLDKNIESPWTGPH